MAQIVEPRTARRPPAAYWRPSPRNETPDLTHPPVAGRRSASSRISASTSDSVLKLVRERAERMNFTRLPPRISGLRRVCGIDEPNRVAGSVTALPAEGDPQGGPSCPRVATVVARCDAYAAQPGNQLTSMPGTETPM